MFAVPDDGVLPEDYFVHDPRESAVVFCERWGWLLCGCDARLGGPGGCACSQARIARIDAAFGRLVELALA